MSFDDDIFWADVRRMFGREAPEHLNPRTSPKLVTAAIISKPRLVLVSVRFGGRGNVQIDPRRSCVMDLGDRSARVLRDLSRRLNRFVERQGISEVYLRARSENTGQYAGHPLNFKIESVVQLERGVNLNFVDDASVRAWCRREDPDVPECPFPELGTRWAAVQDKATETALYVASHWGQSRCFSDGSASHG
jgi:hypothetical protein